MLNLNDLKALASLEGNDNYCVSMYLNVDPLHNQRGDFLVHFKNMMKETSESLDKAVYKRVKADLDKIDAYVFANKRLFKKGLSIISSSESGLWREFNLSVPVMNDLRVEKAPFIRPLLDILDRHERYAVLLVDKESARIFVVHLGEIVEYGEVHTPDIPGKHKKGGWFALSQNNFERHTDVHVGLHLKEVTERLAEFMSGEAIGRVIIGGSDEAFSMVKGILNKGILEKVIGTVKVEMFAKNDDVIKKVEPVVAAYEKEKNNAMVKDLVAKAMKNERAVLGLDNVLHVLQEQRVMRLVYSRQYRASGFSCPSCNALATQPADACPYCKGPLTPVDTIVDLAGQKAIQQGAPIDVIDANKELEDAGGIGAFLRF